MADKNNLVVTISGDSKDLEKALSNVINSSNKMAKTVEGNSNVFDIFSKQVKGFDSIAGTSFGNAAAKAEGLSASIGTVGIALGAVALAAAGIYGAFKFAELGEQNDKIAKNFSMFATQAGLDADGLKEKISNIADGYVDLEDVLPRAGEAVNNLGKNAAKLPELFQLARNIGVTTGRDINDVFSQLTKGVENQNEKLLKSNLIRVDTQKAIDAYAASLGVSSDRLSEAGKQQAVLNAVLEKGKENFGDNEKAAAPLEGGLRKLALAFDDIKDAVAALANSKLGEFFAAGITGTANAISTIAKSFSDLGKNVTTIDEDIAKTTATLARFNELKLGNVNDPTYDKKIQELTEKLNNLKTVQEAVLNAKSNAPDPAALNRDDAIDPLSAKAQKEKADKILAIDADTKLSLQQQQIDHFAAMTELELGKYASDEDLAQVKYEALIARNDAELQATLDKNSAIKDSDERAAQDALARQKALTVATKAEDDKKLALLKANKDIEKSYDQLTSQEKVSNLKDTLSNLSALTSSSSEELFAIGKAASLANATVSGYEAVQKALASAPPPFNFALAALVGVASAANIAKIAGSQPPKATGAANGALVTGGVSGQDTNPFMLAKGEIVAPEKSYDNVIDGELRARGYVKGGENDDIIEVLYMILAKLQDPTVNIYTDYFGGDDNSINRLAEKLRDAREFRDAGV